MLTKIRVQTASGDIIVKFAKVEGDKATCGRSVYYLMKNDIWSIKRDYRVSDGSMVIYAHAFNEHHAENIARAHGMEYPRARLTKIKGGWTE